MTERRCRGCSRQPSREAQVQEPLSPVPHDEERTDPSSVRHRAVLESTALLQGRREVIIRHDGQDYRLRITRQQKLLLTK